MNETEETYPCVGVCLFDPDNGYCLGCGRPPLPVSIVGQGSGSAGVNENTPLPHSTSTANQEPALNQALARNSQEK